MTQIWNFDLYMTIYNLVHYFALGILSISLVVVDKNYYNNRLEWASEDKNEEWCVARKFSGMLQNTCNK